MPIGPIVGIVTALMGARQSLRDTKGRPRDWRTYLLWASAGITVAVAVADAVRASKDAQAAEAASRQGKLAKRRR